MYIYEKKKIAPYFKVDFFPISSCWPTVPPLLRWRTPLCKIRDPDKALSNLEPLHSLQNDLFYINIVILPCILSATNKAITENFLNLI